jgi:hypothetical protein
VIQHCCLTYKDFVKRFLREHQSMGIYLYGELANSKSKQLNKLALDTFEELKLEMDSSTVTNITELLSHLQ